ncbi:MAG: hypothetical protein GY807_06930 [Gammaproteobacteria bacterium]|nr:hypothetical protein [Gammaproteobacteria bacterium]
MFDRTNITRRAVVKGLAAILPVGLVGGLHSAWASTSTMEDDMNVAINHADIENTKKGFWQSLTEAEDGECVDTMYALYDRHGLSFDDMHDEFDHLDRNRRLSMEDFRVWARRKWECGPTFQSDAINACTLLPPDFKHFTVYASIKLKREPGDLVVVGRYPEFTVEQFVQEDDRHRTTGRRVFRVEFEVD